MALIKCKECGNEVSDKAYDCPKCGVSLRKLERSEFGNLVKIFFIIFNVLMALWFISAMVSVSSIYSNATSPAETAGATIGTGIGMVFIFIIWGGGATVLGLLTLFTRPKK